MSVTATSIQHSAGRRPNFSFSRRPTATSPAAKPRAQPPSRGSSSRGGGGGDKRAAKEHEILFQKFFKSVGPRTYASQVKRATNGNQYLVLTEGKRDDKTGDVRKCRVFVYSEDFVEFFRLIKAAAEFIKDHPLPADVRRKRDEFWAKQRASVAHAPAGAAPTGAAPAKAPGPAALAAPARGVALRT